MSNHACYRATRIVTDMVCLGVGMKATSMQLHHERGCLRAVVRPGRMKALHNVDMKQKALSLWLSYSSIIYLPGQPTNFSISTQFVLTSSPNAV